MKNIIIIFIVLAQYGCAGESYYYKNNQKVNLTPKTFISRSSSSIDYYQNDKGIMLGVTDKLIVKLKDNKDLKNILNDFHLIVEKKLSKNLYLLKTSNKNLTIELSNTLTKKDFVEYVHPDFIKKLHKR